MGGGRPFVRLHRCSLHRGGNLHWDWLRQTGELRDYDISHLGNMCTQGLEVLVTMCLQR